MKKRHRGVEHKQQGRLNELCNRTGLNYMTDLARGKRLKCVVLIPLCLTLNGCVVANLGMWLQIMRYSGDGVIHSCSSSHPVIATLVSWPGYQIEFPKFRADGPYEASYRLSNIPQVPGFPAVIYLRFNQPDGVAEKKKDLVTAVFRITLCDTTGRILHSAELSGSTSIWEGGGPSFGVYDLKESELHFEAGASYILHVSYDPGEVPLPGDNLHFSIEHGCSK